MKITYPLVSHRTLNYDESIANPKIQNFCPFCVNIATELRRKESQDDIILQSTRYIAGPRFRCLMLPISMDICLLLSTVRNQ